jgi:hypothetical protein
VLRAIFRDIVGRLNTAACAYAMVGRIALVLHERARFVGAIEIVAGRGTDGREHAVDFEQVARVRFPAHMDPKLCLQPIEMRLRPCPVRPRRVCWRRRSPVDGSVCRRGWRARNICSGCGAGRTPSTITLTPPR